MTSRSATIHLAIVLSATIPGVMCAQQRTPADTARSARDTTQLAPVSVTVTRDRARSPLELPYAITIAHPDSERPGQRHLSLDETLLLVPGVTVANRNNPTQDPRVSIRGFGARSAFGVRGVRVLRDGIPLTLPDGQTPVDYLDLESVGSVEVIRGTASALYGNAAGGVIDLHSAPPPAEPLGGSLRGWDGSFDSRRFVASLGGTSRDSAWRYQGDVAQSSTSGFRSYSHQRTTNAFGRVATTLGGTDLAAEGMAFNEPVAENPGDLTAQQLAQNPDQADPLSVRKRARKTVQQEQLGLIASRPLSGALAGGDVTATVFGGWRTFENPQTFSFIDVSRTSWGSSIRGTLPFTLFGLPHSVSVGVDVQGERDDRREWQNCDDSVPAPVSVKCPTFGAERGMPTKDEIELVASGGPFARLEARVTSRLWLSAGVRADWVRFEVDDRLIVPGNPDDSGNRNLSAVSPMFGATWRIGQLTLLYASISGSFETPTITELVNKPDGSAGLNPTLEPQYATTYETGLKGWLRDRVAYDVAVFDTHVRDELVPFEAPDTSGRRYYRNAGRTDRRGIELGLATELAEMMGGTVHVGASYSYSDFHFDQFTVDTGGKHLDFAGNRIPGIPIQQAQASVTWRRRDFFATLEGIAASSVYVNDANAARSAGYQIANVRIGSSGVFGASWLAPVLGLENAFDRRYVGSVTVNAAGGKFYEPAPGRVVFAGLTLSR